MKQAKEYLPKRSAPRVKLIQARVSDDLFSWVKSYQRTTGFHIADIICAALALLRDSLKSGK